MKFFILGFMGAGKSHIGRKLAQRLDIPFLDMDEQLEALCGKSISILFEEQGEEAFRKLERKYLQSLETVTYAVIATGGGAPCFKDNMELIKSQGKSIYLRTPTKLLASRLSNERAKRPLIANLAEDDLEGYIENKLQERSPYYEQAELVYFQEEEGQEIVTELLERLSTDS